MAKELMARKDVPVKMTWNLSQIYATEEEMYADVKKMETLREQMIIKYKGKLKNAVMINECLDDLRKLNEWMNLVSHYTDLAVSVDYYNVADQERNGKINRMIANTSSLLSFIESEIVEQEDEVIKEAIEATKENKCYLEDLLRSKKHRLHPEAERVLAAISQTTESPYEVYNSAKFADMKFEPFVVEGKQYPLGYSLFEDDYEYDSRTPVRRAAFEAFSKKIREYENVTATAYNTLVQHEKAMSNLRGFDSVIDSLLFEQKVDKELYNRQIDVIMEKLAPHMRKYARLIKKLHHLDKMTFADLKLPIDAEYDPKVTIEDSKKYIKKGLAILGEDYVKMIDQAYDERWIDFAQNKGKSTGGFCASPYGRNSFILLTWNERMSDVFTLAHELGHAGHFKACNSKQSIFDVEVSNYFVEAPSTMNELLMAHYLLKNSKDNRFRRWVLSSMVSNTYYHNFVTHLIEAAYQREVYKIVDAGGSVQADTLNSIMRDTLKKFWGEEVEIIEGAELTWMRQPHYYMGLYSYTYSAGLTIATQVCKRIENEGKAAIEDWKKVLEAGNTKTPVELAKMAGVDITTDKALMDTIDIIGEMIDEICRLSDID